MNTQLTTTQDQQTKIELPRTAIDTFLQTNPDFNLERFNFFNQTALAALQWGDTDHEALVPQLKALQRLIRLTGNQETAAALYEQGLHSAIQIASMPQHRFVEQYATAFPANGRSSAEQAQHVHQQALARKSQAVLTYVAIAQHTAPFYRASRFDNLSVLTANNYNGLPDYQGLFGQLDYCTCPDCQTIFSPAAYFVDLMRLQDHYITPPATPLQSRRPDLWTRELSCDNTNTPVPKLQIVNEVLAARAYYVQGQNKSQPQGMTATTISNIPRINALSNLAVTKFNNQLYCFYKQNNNTGLHYVTYTGSDWTKPQQVAGVLMSPTSGISAGIYNGVLRCFYEDTAEALCYAEYNQLVWVSKVSFADTITPSSNSSEVVFGKNLYSFYQKNDQNLYYYRYEYEKKWAETSLSGKTNSKMVPNIGPSAVKFNDQIYCFYAGIDGKQGSGVLYYTRNLSSKPGEWAPPTPVTPAPAPVTPVTPVPAILMYAGSGPAAVVVHDRLYCFYKKHDDATLNYTAFDAVKQAWGQGVQVQQASKPISMAPGSPFAVLELFGVIYCFYCATDNTLRCISIGEGQQALTPLQTKDVYRSLATSQYPFNLPFHLPLTQIRQYLQHSKVRLSTLWHDLSPDAEQKTTPIAREILALSPEQWTLYSTSTTDKTTDKTTLANDYGYPNAPADFALAQTLSSVQTFVQKTGLSREQLNTLLYGDLSDGEVTNTLHTQFFINAGDNAPPIALENDAKGMLTLTNLTVPRLDRINRFVRLAQALGWSFTDLDWALRTIGWLVNLPHNDDALPYLAWMQMLKNEYHFSINQCCALIGTVKDFGQKDGPTFFEQIFHDATIPNPPAWKDEEGNYSLIWHVPTLSESSEGTDQDQQIQNALAAALQVSHDDLLTIARGLIAEMQLGMQALERQVPMAQASSRPAVVMFQETLYCFYQDPKSQKLCYTTSTNPGDPSTWQAKEIANSSALQSGHPTAVVFNEQLYCFATDMTPTNSPRPPILYNILTGNIRAIGPDTSGNIGSVLQPRTEAVFNDHLYCFAQNGSHNGYIYWTRSRTPDDASSWRWSNTAGHLPLTVCTDETPSVVEFKGKLYCFYIANGNANNKSHAVDRGVLNIAISPNGLGWSQSYQLPDVNILPGSSPCAVSFDDRLYCFYTAQDHGLYYSVSDEPEKPSSWQTNIRVANISLSSSPAVVVFNNQLYCFYQKSINDPGLWYSTLKKATPGNKFPLRLTLQNLSRLYRLSQLPALTGLSINECFTALQLPGQPTRPLRQLTISSSAHAFAAWSSFVKFGQWLKSTTLSVYQLQYLLTGQSQNATIQNQRLGADALKNFLQEMNLAITPVLLTEEQFNTAVSTTLLQQAGSKDQADGWAQGLWKKLQPDAGSQGGVVYVDSSGVVVTQIQDPASITDMVQVIIFPKDDGTRKAFLTQVAALIANTLNQSYRLQHNTLSQQLINVYNISSQLVPALELASKLNLADIVTVAKAVSASTDKTVAIETKRQKVVEKLLFLQQYAQIVKTLSVSPAEAQAIAKHPQSFGITLGKDGLPLLTVTNFQTLYKFKKLVQDLHDTQNHLLSYFDLAVGEKPSAVDSVTELARITQWPTEQITFLSDKLGLKVLISASSPTPRYATVEGVALLQAYFTTAQQLNTDIRGLWQLVQLSTEEDYESYQTAADALWGGLQGQYREQPDALMGIQNTLGVAQRDALVGFVINKLSTPDISTVRDLSEYLLIDVEVTGAVQTSYISEAISAVQLYIYRCLNHLEHDVMVQKDLIAWWPWMEHYQTWRANREVFLYPENYIQPELRKQKSPQFAKLEQDLLQSTLNEAAVDSAVKAYVESFAEVANLRIVGSYLYGSDATDLPAQQHLYLVGRTTTQPYHYYYRTAIFTLNATEYEVTQWSPWTPIDLQITSSVVSPVYAFDKLFLFWVEIKPGEPDTNTDGKIIHKRFEAILNYSFYNFNKSWVAPQQIGMPVRLPETVNTPGRAGQPRWQQLRAVFDATTNLVYWSYVHEASVIRGGTLDDQLALTPLATVWIGDGAANKVYIYHFGDYGEWTQHPDQTLDKPADAGSYFGSSVDSDGEWMIVGDHGEGTGTQHKPKAYLYRLQGGTWPQQPTQILAQPDNAQRNFGESVAVSGGWAIVGDKLANTGFTYQLNGTWKAQGSIPIIKSLIHFGHLVDISGDWAVLGSDKSNLVFWFQYDYDKDQWISRDGKIIDTENQDTIPSALALYGSLAMVGIAQKKTVQIYQLQGNNWSTPSSLPCPPNPASNFGYAVAIDKDWAVVGGYTDSQTALTPLPSIAPPLGRTIYAYVYHYDGKEWKFITTLSREGGTSNSNISVAIEFNLPTNERIRQYLGAKKDGQSIPLDVVAGTQLTWSITTGPDGTQFLQIPTQETAIRLNDMVVNQLSKALFSQGIAGLLALDTQKTPERKMDGTFTATLDFAGANGLYYWELFFHMPFLVGRSFNTQQQFEAAKKWYEYIFNPTVNNATLTEAAASGDDRRDTYWRFLYLRSQWNPTLQGELTQAWSAEVQTDTVDPAQLYEYHTDPFDPHAIATLRPIAYQKTIVMHYIDNLLDWGDTLFRQYTAETIAEATMFYMMAYDLLGKQPTNLGPCPLPAPATLEQIAKEAKEAKEKIGKIPEFLIHLEQSQLDSPVVRASDNPSNYIPGDYFGLPENALFIAYWDKVQDRLAKIRHGLDINGKPRNLLLFQPPLDPRQLVSEVASGEGSGSPIGSNQVEIPHYRFTVMSTKAKEVTQTVMQLGQSLLSVLEKNDAEQLSLLYNSNQKNLLALMRTSKKDQVEAATQSLNALQASHKSAQDRYNHYSKLLNAGNNQQHLFTEALNSGLATALNSGLATGLTELAGIPGNIASSIGQALSDRAAPQLDRLESFIGTLAQGLSSHEKMQIGLEDAAIASQASAQAIKLASIVAYLLPNIFGLADGGMKFGDAVNQGANIAEGLANALSMSSNLAGTIAGYQRRAEDWQLQQSLAQDDIEQIQYQIAAAQYQQRIAQEDMLLLEKQIAQEQAVETYLKNKFTRQQMYQWLTGKLATLYVQAYQLAFDLALQAQQAWQFERGNDQQTFIQSGSWNDLYHGLVAGEALQLDIQRMEKAYMDQDQRRLEIVKVISLKQLNAKAFEDFQGTGAAQDTASCIFELSEKDFDLDYPGHYCRQIRSISLSFPALLGPYQNIHATLTQTSSTTVLKADQSAVNYLYPQTAKPANLTKPPPPAPSVLREDVRANQQVTLSQGLNDSGLFELNFNDARYLPFEGTGAVSNWKLEIQTKNATNQGLDLSSLTDVIIRLQYTALAGGESFKAHVKCLVIKSTSKTS